LSDSIYNSVGDLCSIILHMRNGDGERDDDRVLVAIGSPSEDAKDNLGVVLPRYKNGVIKFGTEEEAVDKLMGCFDRQKGGDTAVKTVKKKVKKKVKRARE